ncbi:MAG: protein kinase [bacterium]
MNSNPQDDALQIGQIYEGKYKILRELGRGGFGMVYLAYQEPMDRYVALKALRSGVTLSAPSAKERFLREVKIISKLRHPNTVTIHDFGETRDGGVYMTLEYVEGETLKQQLKREFTIDPVRASHIARQIAKSLSEAHRLGIVHRDLKPANIMITNLESEKDFVKVLDFGVARLLDPKTSDLTSVGLPEGERELIGTPRYMSPEQVRGEALTGASDIYSLGLILYEMITGEPAVQGDSTMGLISQQISPEMLRLPLLNSFDPMLQDIVRIGTAKAVHDRFQTAEQMADALEQFLNKSRSGRNAIGMHADMVQGYQPPNTPGSGWNQQPGWNQASGWNQQSGWNQGQDVPRNQYGSGQQPSGQYPAQNPYQTMPPQQSPYNSGLNANPFATMPPQQNPYGTMPPQQSPYGTMPPQQSPFQGNQPPQANPYQTMPPQQSPFGTMPPQQSPYQQPGLPPAPGLASSGQLPLQGNEDFGEIQLDRNLEFEDFQATVERGALDRSQLRAAAGFSREIPSLSELPPPPADERPFQPPPEPQKAVPLQVDRTMAPRPVVKKNDDDLLGFTVEIVKVLALTTLFLAVGFVGFIIFGAALAAYAEGPLRVIASFAVVGVVALLAAVGETSQRERFQVVTRATDRIVRILISSVVFTLALILLAAGLESDGVVRELRTEPNWFLTSQDSKLARGNRNLSYGLADAVASTMGALGLYDDRRGSAPPKPNVIVPTRPSNRTPLKPNDDGASTKPSEEKTPAKKSDYVDW